MSENTFLYTVKPRKTIVGLSGSTKVIRTAKSVYLTKEDVYLCLKNAVVYRRFANEGINERVTIDSVERVHRDKYISEKDWHAFLTMEASKGNGEVKAVVEETIVEDDGPDKVPDAEELAEELAAKEKESNHQEEMSSIEEVATDVEDEETVESDDDEVIEKDEE